MLIAHRCPKCKHPDYRRREADVDAKRGPCECGCKCTASEPTTVPTFDVAGRVVERVVKPGERLGKDLDNGLGNTNGTSVTACNCAACKALYAQLTTV